jgi:hypothetical protein
MRSGELMKWNEAAVQGSNEACFVVNTEVRGAFKNVKVALGNSPVRTAGAHRRQE